MERSISYYFEGVEAPRVKGRCQHLLSDILLTALCTYITGGFDYQDMHLLAKERGNQMQGLLQLPRMFAEKFEK